MSSPLIFKQQQHKSATHCPEFSPSQSLYADNAERKATKRMRIAIERRIVVILHIVFCFVLKVASLEEKEEEEIYKTKSTTTWNQTRREEKRAAVGCRIIKETKERKREEER